MNEEEKPALKPANENRWYWLATLYGESSNNLEQDLDIAQKNRIAWNRWFAKALSAEQLNELLKKGFAPEELVPLTPKEEEALAIAFTNRSGRKDRSLPEPTATIDFSHTIFDSKVFFMGFIFPGVANFNSATFTGYAYFESVTFTGNANFESATFTGYANFNSATFTEGAYFESVTFIELAFFESATFTGPANFVSTTFTRYASFISATFTRGAYFVSTTFTGYAYFISATFTEGANFESATFSGDANFGSATFSDQINFINSEFTAKTIFANAHFYSMVPDFRGAKMHEATEWHKVIWPSIPTDKKIAQDQIYTYERLKQEMERLKKHEEEQFFFRKELRVRRELKPFWSVAWLLNFLYEALSDYGQSTNKSLLWLGGLFLLGGAGFAWSLDNAGTCWTIQYVASLSFASIFPFLPFYKEVVTPDVFASLSNLAKIIVVVQSIFGTLMLFLLGLALRNRFRMR